MVTNARQSETFWEFQWRNSTHTHHGKTLSSKVVLLTNCNFVFIPQHDIVRSEIPMNNPFLFMQITKSQTKLKKKQKEPYKDSQLQPK